MQKTQTEDGLLPAMGAGRGEAGGGTCVPRVRGGLLDAGLHMECLLGVVGWRGGVAQVSGVGRKKRLREGGSLGFPGDGIEAGAQVWARGCVKTGTAGRELEYLD